MYQIQSIYPQISNHSFSQRPILLRTSSNHSIFHRVVADSTLNGTTTPNASIGLTTTFSLVNCKCLSYLFHMRSRLKGSMSPFPLHSPTAVHPDCGLVAGGGVRPIRGRINHNAISSLIHSSDVMLCVIFDSAKIYTNKFSSPRSKNHHDAFCCTCLPGLTCDDNGTLRLPSHASRTQLYTIQRSITIICDWARTE